MRTSYPGYERRTDRNLEELWAECVFTFDASALLDLYRLTPDARDAVLNLLERLKERLWLPHQAGLEYHDNRIQVISTGLDSYSRIPELARDIAKTYRKNLDNYRQYRWIEAERWAGLLDEAVKKIEDTISKQQRVLGNFLETDPVEQRLNEIFHGKVGPPYKDFHDIYVRAEQRLQLSIPPGFKDAAVKKDFHRYGDVVLWFQLLDYAKSEKKGIIFVTSDAKTDWWLERSGKTIGPRPELLQEMHATAGVTFHMYSPDRFVEYAEKHVKSKVRPAILKKTAQELRAVETEKSAETARARDELLKRIAEIKPFEVRLSDDLAKSLAAMTQVRLSDDLAKSLAAMTQVRLSDDLAKSLAATTQVRLSDDLAKSLAAMTQVRLSDDLANSLAAMTQVRLSDDLAKSLAAMERNDLDEKNLPNTSTGLPRQAAEGKQDPPKSNNEKDKPK